MRRAGLGDCTITAASFVAVEALFVGGIGEARAVGIAGEVAFDLGFFGRVSAAADEGEQQGRKYQSQSISQHEQAPVERLQSFIS